MNMSQTVTETATEHSAMNANTAGAHESFGATISHTNQPTIPESRASLDSWDFATPANGVQTPDPLLLREALRVQDADQDISELTRELERVTSQQRGAHMGTAMENLARSSKLYRVPVSSVR